TLPLPPHPVKGYFVDTPPVVGDTEVVIGRCRDGIGVKRFTSPGPNGVRELKLQDDLEVGDQDEERIQARKTKPQDRTECPWCGTPLNDPFVCDYCEWGAGGES
ncbi:MAG: hypothetical protein ACREJW_07940, partial [Candidatus Methylomirabilales bacterium]